MLDGNAVAGLLQEVFALEMTNAMARCQSCGATNAVGSLRVFRGAAVALHCPHCEETLLTIVKDGPRVWMAFVGLRALHVSMPAPAD